MDNLSYLEQSASNKNISILSIPQNLGSDCFDTKNAPQYLIDGLAPALSSLGFNLSILPTVEILAGDSLDKEFCFGEVARTIPFIQTTVKKEIVSGKTILTLGGDHSIAIGTISGALAALGDDLGVLWIDAHSDIQTKETSLSRNVHGMPVATLLGLGDGRLTSLLPVKLKPENILYIGLKDLDQFEIDTIRKHNITAITMLDIVENGLSIVTEAIDLFQTKTSKVWVSMDMDSIDKQYAPAVAMSSSGGFTYREITGLLTYIGKTLSVAGMDIVEVSPKKDVEGVTKELCTQLVTACFGSKYDWYRSYMNKYQQ
jgi:arginase